MSVAIIDYDAGNIRSVDFALQRLGVDSFLTSDPQKILAADRVIFPGVGESGWAMKALNEKGLDTLIPSLTQPVLGICLGMQLLCSHSEEGNTEGLGVFPLSVKKFQTSLKIPHMGWNRLEHMQSALFRNLEPEAASVYFVHSYYVPRSRFSIALTDYDGDFSAAVHKNNFWGCQFHPEKSGPAGEQILKNFLEI